jgi:hypothetical protein
VQLKRTALRGVKGILCYQYSQKRNNPKQSVITHHQVIGEAIEVQYHHSWYPRPAQWINEIADQINRST